MRISYPFAAVPNQIIRGGHGAINLAVLTALLSHGKTTCSVNKLAKEIGCNRKSIFPAIRYWMERGAEFGIVLKAKTKNGAPTVYEIDVHTMQEPDPKTVQVSEMTSTENGTPPDPKTGHPPVPKTGHKEEPYKKNPKENYPPYPPQKFFVGDNPNREADLKLGRSQSSNFEGIGDILKTKGRSFHH